MKENPSKILSLKNIKNDNAIERDFIVGALKVNVFETEELDKMLQII